MRSISLVRTVSALAVMAGLAGGLGACTTIEGTNAMVDPGTFEREVADQTLEGLGMIPRAEKPPIKTPRAPLALPKDTASLPPPEPDQSSLLPEDSDKVQIDMTGLTDEDIQRLRNAKVVDLRSIAGRPLTDIEARQLTARMQAAHMAVSASTQRPLFLPPDEYFTTVNGQDLVCLAENGDLVPLTDPACPESIRQALQSQAK